MAADAAKTKMNKENEDATESILLVVRLFGVMSNRLIPYQREDRQQWSMDYLMEEAPEPSTLQTLSIYHSTVHSQCSPRAKVLTRRGTLSVEDGENTQQVEQ